MPVEHSSSVPVAFVTGRLELKPGLHGEVGGSGGAGVADVFSGVRVSLPAFCCPGGLLAGITDMLLCVLFPFPITLLPLQPQADLLLPAVSTERLQTSAICRERKYIF